jgi:acyl-CoA synthetase (NDP forming)
LKGGRFGGHVFPVNPAYRELAGVQCYPDLSALPEVPDCAAFAVSDARIETAFSEAARAGVRAAILFGRTYEPEAVGRRSLAERLADIARDANMAVCGGNCMGYVNFVDGIRATAGAPPTSDQAGPISLISHSGSTWVGLIGNQRQLQYNYAISSGQEIATGVGDYIEFCLQEPETRVVGCILETVRDAERFLQAIEAADRKGVPIVILTIGRSEPGRRFAFAHSGALASSDAAYRAIFERYNVIRVATVDEMTDTLELVRGTRRPPVDGLGIATGSGGERELIVDLAGDVGAAVAELTPGSVARLTTILDPGMSGANPVDFYGDGTMPIKECLDVLAEDPNVGIVALASNMVAGTAYLHTCSEALEYILPRTGKPVVTFGNLHSSICRDEAARLRARGIPVLMGTSTALMAMRHLGEWARRRREGRPVLSTRSATGPSREHLERLLPTTPQTSLGPAQAWALLSAFDIPVVQSTLVTDEAGAVRAADAIGFPVVVKTAAAEMLHKTDVGGVMLGLGGPGEVAAAYRGIAGRLGPIVQVQAQAEAGLEILLGMVNDPVFGPLMTVGLGGIHTEVLGDVITLVPPLAAAEAVDHVRRLKGARLLAGYRGSPAVDVGALGMVIERFSVLCAVIGARFSEIDLNPLIVGSRGAVVVDALFITQSDGAPP